MQCVAPKQWTACEIGRRDSPSGQRERRRGSLSASLIETAPCIVIGYSLQLVHKQQTTCQTLKESCSQTHTHTHNLSRVPSLSLSFSLSLENTKNTYYGNATSYDLAPTQQPALQPVHAFGSKFSGERIHCVLSLVSYTMALWEFLYRTTSGWSKYYCTLIVYFLQKYCQSESCWIGIGRCIVVWASEMIAFEVEQFITIMSSLVERWHTPSDNRLTDMHTWYSRPK